MLVPRAEPVMAYNLQGMTEGPPCSSCLELRNPMAGSQIVLGVAPSSSSAARGSHALLPNGSGKLATAA